MAKYKTRRRKNYDRTEPPRDYMKYWRVVKYWTRNKYDITLGELDMMLFLYSEGIFNKDQFDEFNRLVGWNKNRFKTKALHERARHFGASPLYRGKQKVQT